MSDQVSYGLKHFWRIMTFSAFRMGEKDISLLLFVEVLVLLAVAFLFSMQLRKVLKVRLAKTRMDEGVQYTVLRLVHYTIVAIVFYQAIAMIGINLKGLAFLVGILSVGIGFGLQNIVNNFVSGLILLFERPIKPGDMISAGDTEGRVEEINMRATTMVTLDNVSVIVPNSQFISGEVINWSHRDPKVRIHIPIGVAYGSDVQLVTESLLQVGKDHPDVLDEPASMVFFVGFGNSSLDFELLVWIDKPLLQRQVRSDLNYAIDRIFRQNEVTIPFPQRDVHLRSMPPRGTLDTP
ncbi:MAG: mechanosensitive ion channel domain-containing protein [Candidatus Latescibacterota bacterium]